MAPEGDVSRANQEDGFWRNCFDSLAHALDHGDADHHDEQRGDVVASCEVVERLLEEEHTAADERDSEYFEEVTTHDLLTDDAA
jgi:hypothetical protein